MSAGESTFSGVRLTRSTTPLPRLRYGGRSYEASVGTLDDVWDAIFDVYPRAYEDEYEAKRVLELVNERRLATVHRFDAGRAVEFLYSADLIRKALPQLLESDA